MLLTQLFLTEVEFVFPLKDLNLEFEKIFPGLPSAWGWSSRGKLLWLATKGGGGEGVGLFANPTRHLTLLVVHAFLSIFIHFNMSLSCPQNTLANCLLIQWKFVLEEVVLGTQAVTPALFVQYSCWHLRGCSVECTPGTYLLYHQLHF